MHRKKSSNFLYTWLHCNNCVIKVKLTLLEMFSPFTSSVYHVDIHFNPPPAHSNCKQNRDESFSSVFPFGSSSFWKITNLSTPNVDEHSKFKVRNLFTLSPHRNVIKRRVTMLRKKNLLFICNSVLSSRTFYYFPLIRTMLLRTENFVI